MTEFEKQVSEALVHVLTEGAPSAEPAIRFVAGQLAPRVAAAISQAHGTQGPKALLILRADALRALRGASGETPQP